MFESGTKWLAEGIPLAPCPSYRKWGLTESKGEAIAAAVLLEQANVLDRCSLRGSVHYEPEIVHEARRRAALAPAAAPAGHMPERLWPLHVAAVTPQAPATPERRVPALAVGTTPPPAGKPASFIAALLTPNKHSAARSGSPPALAAAASAAVLGPADGVSAASPDPPATPDHAASDPVPALHAAAAADSERSTPAALGAGGRAAGDDSGGLQTPPGRCSIAAGARRAAGSSYADMAAAAAAVRAEFNGKGIKECEIEVVLRVESRACDTGCGTKAAPFEEDGGDEALLEEGLGKGRPRQRRRSGLRLALRQLCF